MIRREEDFTTSVQEISSKTIGDESKIPKLAPARASTSWSRFKDPRIVRVSRVFGGKDRHSKVRTAKGLRDRRVRLSVPTAIQLYDLQDRLGLSQPSKVVDWLLSAAKDDIDELAPLQFPHGLSFTTQSTFEPISSNFLEFGDSQSNKLQGLKIRGRVSDHTSMKHQSSSLSWGNSMDVSGETSGRDENWARYEDESGHMVSRQNPTSFSSFLTSISSQNPFFRWDPSNLTLSQPTQGHGLSIDRANEDLRINSSLPMPPMISVGSGSQVLVYQSGMAAQSCFSSQNTGTINVEFDPKQMDHNHQILQLSNSSLTSPVNSAPGISARPFRFGITANLHSSQNNAANQ